jgi:nicotinate-nucleotide--dimethylbenzimidazole phosphoribosyltransferase
VPLVSAPIRFPTTRPRAHLPPDLIGPRPAPPLRCAAPGLRSAAPGLRSAPSPGALPTPVPANKPSHIISRQAPSRSCEHDLRPPPAPRRLPLPTLNSSPALQAGDNTSASTTPPSSRWPTRPRSSHCTTRASTYSGWPATPRKVAYSQTAIDRTGTESSGRPRRTPSSPSPLPLVGAAQP